MKLGSLARLPQKCFYPQCPSHAQKSGTCPIVRKGFFRRSSDSRTLARFRCKVCQRTFSQASFSECFGQKKRRLNSPIYRLLCSAVSQRRIARLLGISLNTVARKLTFLDQQVTRRQEADLESRKQAPEKLASVFFDEMESFERSKGLPVSIPILVEPKTRKILGIGVASMPAKGPLAKQARERYGKRADERPQVANALLESVKGVLREDVKVMSDRNPKYPGWLKQVFPKGKHQTVKGRRGCGVGQGELKRGGFDPLFDLNHTCAMIRANVNRLFRRTWNTTKKRDRLAAHLRLYMDYHNRVLTA